MSEGARLLHDSLSSSPAPGLWLLAVVLCCLCSAHFASAVNLTEVGAQLKRDLIAMHAQLYPNWDNSLSPCDWQVRGRVAWAQPQPL